MDNLDNAVQEFKHQAALIIATGNKTALKELFARWYVALRARQPQGGLEVISAMRGALRDVFLQPTRKIKTGRFDDL